MINVNEQNKSFSKHLSNSSLSPDEIAFKVATYNSPKKLSDIFPNQSELIVFPKQLLGDLIAFISRKTNSNPSRWGFVSEGYFSVKERSLAGLPQSNKPSKLLEKRKLGLTLSTTEEELIDQYLSDFNYVKNLTNTAIKNARSKSNLTQRALILAFDLYRPVDNQSKSHQKLQRQALNADPRLRKSILKLERDFRKIARQTRECLAYHAMLVGGKHGRSRATNSAVSDRKAQLKKQDQFISGKVIVNEQTNQKFELPTTDQKRNSKLCEMYAITKGIEHQLVSAKSCGWLSAVATAPAEMHANPKSGNNTWSGILPNEVASYFTDKWALFRAHCAKRNIKISGLWTREVHLDGCPHMNLFIGFEDKYYRVIKTLLIRVFGHSKQAIKVQKGGKNEKDNRKDYKPASFASYCMKYFLKNFESFGTSIDADAEEATASIFSYRRYGFFGLPSISQWRELRRLKTKPAGNPHLSRLWQAVHKGDAGTWIKLSGGLACRRSERPIQTLRNGHRTVGLKQVFQPYFYKKHNLLSDEVSFDEHLVGRKQVIYQLITRTNTYEIRDKKELEDSGVTLILNYPRTDRSLKKTTKQAHTRGPSKRGVWLAQGSDLPYVPLQKNKELDNG